MPVWGSFTGGGFSKRQSALSYVRQNLLFSVDAANYSTGNWLDDSGNGYQFAPTNGPTYVSGALPYWSMDGSDDHFVSTASIELRQNFTLETWVYVTGNGSGFFGQGTATNNDGLHIMWNAYPSNRGIIFGMYANDLDSATFNLSFSTWYNFAFTYNHSTYLKQFYSNGSLFNSGAGSAYTGTGQLRLANIFGTSYTNNSNVLKGRFAIARMYTSVLSAAQISQNFNALRGRFGI